MRNKDQLRSVIINSLVAVIFGTLASTGIPQTGAGAIAIWAVVAAGAVAFVYGIKVATRAEELPEEPIYVQRNVRKEEARQQEAA